MTHDILAGLKYGLPLAILMWAFVLGVLWHAVAG